MKRLHDKVNVIPLIAKADTLTPEECQLFKKQVLLCACPTLMACPAICSTDEYKKYVWRNVAYNHYFPSCQIMKEIQEHKIKIYEFPDTEDEEDNKLIRKIKVINKARRMLVIYAKLSL